VSSRLFPLSIKIKFQGCYFRDVLLAAGFDEEKHPEVRHVQFEGKYGTTRKWFATLSISSNSV
jgi:hypothetical protein